MDAESKRISEEIQYRYDACQRTFHAPISLKVALSSMKYLKIENRLSIYYMFLDGKGLLHTVGTATRISAATFLDSNGESYSQSVKGVWFAFVQTWSTVYPGYSYCLLADQDFVFAFRQWKQLTDPSDFQLRLFELRTHSCLEIGEKLHESFRRIYRNIKHYNFNSLSRLIFNVAVKAMNDTTCENDHIPRK